MHELTYDVNAYLTGDYVVARATVGPVKFEARANWRQIVKRLRKRMPQRRGVEIGLSFWKKLSRKAKAIARKVAHSKVLKTAVKVIRSPAFAAALNVIPVYGQVASAAMLAIQAAWAGVEAMTAKKQGKPELARKKSMEAIAAAKAGGLSAQRFNQAQRYGASLAVDPQDLSFFAQGIPGGEASLRQQAPRPGPGPLWQAIPGIFE